jgi:hypothetical protein
LASNVERAIRITGTPVLSRSTVASEEVGIRATQAADALTACNSWWATRSPLAPMSSTPMHLTSAFGSPQPFYGV